MLIKKYFTDNTTNTHLADNEIHGPSEEKDDENGNGMSNNITISILRI